jgi:hypothetical protein
MKKILLLFLILPCFLKAQEINLPVDSTTNKVSYSEVVPVPGISKDDLYVRGREWFAKTFVSAQAVIQMDDKAAGKIIGKGVGYGTSSFMLTTSRFTIFYTVSLTVKDGRYRYEITDFYFQNPPSQYMRDPPRIPIDEYAMSSKYRNKKGEYKNNFKSVVVAVNTEALKLIEGIKSTLSQSAKGIKAKDDF